MPEGSSPPWNTEVPSPDYPALAANLEVDVAVVGAGITGLTGAYLAVRAGKSVAVLERGSIAGGETGRTTGFLTAVLDARLIDLIAVHGQQGARAAWDSSAKGIELIETQAREEGIECEFRRVDAYLYGPRAKDRRLLARESRWAITFGYPVDSIDPGEIPFPSQAVLRVPAQGRIHPSKYMQGLARAIVRRGGEVYENTNISRLNPRRNGQHPGAVLTDGHGRTVTAGTILLSNNAPFVDKRRMYARLRACRSYAMRAPVSRGSFPEGLFWNTLDPYDYARVDAGSRSDSLILGGADHAVGQVGAPEKAQSKVTAYWDRVVGSRPTGPVRWSGEILNSEDGLPFIGTNPGSPTREMIAMGFGGNGLTLGTPAGWMFCERLLGRTTPWDQVYDPARRTVSTAGTGLAHVPRAPAHRETRAVRSPREIAVGEGAWYSQGGRRLGVYRESGQTFRATDAQCTHLGCSVEWNPVERSWDCPCHGSRFDTHGGVLDGPASRPLVSVELELARPLTRRLRKGPAREG
ncbi:MAG: FAD-dependent oxidoreductase [Thermoplasmata archaeon]|nr:FAD-dependent oxidoreductase [Thermoplasmata archaeon]